MSKLIEKKQNNAPHDVILYNLKYQKTCMVLKENFLIGFKFQ